MGKRAGVVLVEEITMGLDVMISPGQRNKDERKALTERYMVSTIDILHTN